jgi:DNA modification methylase
MKKIITKLKIGDKVGQYGIWKGEERGVYDIRNKLNDLTGKEWIKLTKSVWKSERCVDDKIAFEHPAPFLIKDIIKLVTLFTKNNAIVLDPFAGSGTTLAACALEGRRGIGIDLNKKYCGLMKRRLKKYVKNGQLIINGNSLKKIVDLPEIDYCVTSPPYHNILRHNGGGVRQDRSQKRQGVEYYSNDQYDLGNQKEYQQYRNMLEKIMDKVYKKLKKGKYCSIIISDFTINKKETNVHGDTIELMNRVGFSFEGAVTLVQDSKPLYPFGYPYAYKINHHHQYILNFRK